jgi:hypothetical protein
MMHNNKVVGRRLDVEGLQRMMSSTEFVWN